MVKRACTPEEIKRIKRARQAAKSSGFAVLYGGGAKACMGPITKEFPEFSQEKVKRSADKIIKSKKGERDYDTGEWHGGTWSGAFNYMLRVANSPISTLPCLKSRISTALRSKVVGDKFIPCRQNWVIQASGSEMLSVILVAVQWLAKEEGIEYHFVISVHDQLTFMVKEEDSLKFALVFQKAHLLTWALFHQQLGFNEMPVNRAWFSGVQIDDRLRKDPKESTKTISNDNWESEGPGVEYTMCELTDKKRTIPGI